MSFDEHAEGRRVAVENLDQVLVALVGSRIGADHLELATSARLPSRCPHGRDPQQDEPPQGRRDRSAGLGLRDEGGADGSDERCGVVADGDREGVPGMLGHEAEPEDGVLVPEIEQQAHAGLVELRVEVVLRAPCRGRVAVDRVRSTRVVLGVVP
jgi:hypothetical protein